jgi:Flp pilus assembly protein TadG
MGRYQPVERNARRPTDGVQFAPRRFRRKSRGSAIVEFALGSGVLLAAFAGCFQIGYTLIQYDRLQTAVAQGARYASLAPYDSATATPSSSFLLTVQNMVLYGSPLAGSSPVVSGLKAANVSLVVTFKNGVPGTMQVSISAYTVNALFGLHTLNGKPQATYLYQGVWSPV